MLAAAMTVEWLTWSLLLTSLLLPMACLGKFNFCVLTLPDVACYLVVLLLLPFDLNDWWSSKLCVALRLAFFSPFSRVTLRLLLLIVPTISSPFYYYCC